MTVVAPLLVVLQGQLVKQETGNGMGRGKEMGLEWERNRDKMGHDSVYKCCKGRLGTHNDLVHELSSTTINSFAFSFSDLLGL